jgi:hypothetical protein
MPLTGPGFGARPLIHGESGVGPEARRVRAGFCSDVMSGPSPEVRGRPPSPDVGCRRSGGVWPGA